MPPRSSRRAAGPARPPAARPRREAAALPPAPLSHPAMLLGLLTLLACVLIAPTFQTTDTDFWQHLVVGKAMWTEHRIPMTNQWTWPTFGQPQVLPSWLFRALLWPFWQLGEMNGLQVWRWATTLATFTLLWLAARRLGARGFAAIVMLAWCVLVYRHRVYVRPETLAAVLMALTMFLLLVRRSGGRDHAWWLVLVAWIWANAHISYWMFFALVGIHAFADFFDRTPRRTNLWLVGVAAAAACFVNPFGWKTLEEPFLYAFVWRNDPAFRTIGELQPVDWPFLRTTGYLALFGLWPALTAWRVRRHGWDIAELLTMAAFSVLGLWNQRFVSVWALAAAPYLARGAASLAADISWPALLRSPWARAFVVLVVCIGGSLTDWRRTDLGFGTRVAASSYPAGAAEFMAQHGIRGKGFNHFELGGYLLWRFWPEKERLPFLDIHLTGTPDDRRLAGLMLNRGEAWHQLDAKHRFPWAMLRRLHGAHDISLDILEGDANFALVFLDDAAAFYVRKDGPYAAIADSLAFGIVRAGRAGMATMGRAIAADTTLRPQLEAEFLRMEQSSAANSGAHSMLAQLDLIRGQWASARAHLVAAHAVDPLVPGFHERLGVAWLREGKAPEAVRELQLATAKEKSVGSFAWLGEARLLAGDRDGALKAYQQALERDPGNAIARHGVDALRSGR